MTAISTKFNLGWAGLGRSRLTSLTRANSHPRHRFLRILSLPSRQSNRTHVLLRVRLGHSTSSMLDFQLLKTFDNILVWCDVSTGQNRSYITAKYRRKIFTSRPSHRANWCRSCKGRQTAKVSRHNRLFLKCIK